MMCVAWDNMSQTSSVEMSESAKMEPRTRHLPWHVMVSISVAAKADPKTVKRFCEGYPVMGRGGDRIAEALIARGIAVTGWTLL